MIRRGFWLATGAVTGIVAYRRVSGVGRRLSASLNPAATPKIASARSGVALRQTRRGTIRAARETYRFTRDVREGMALYMARQSAPTLATDRGSTNHEAQPKDGH